MYLLLVFKKLDALLNKEEYLILCLSYYMWVAELHDNLCDIPFESKFDFDHTFFPERF